MTTDRKPAAAAWATGILVATCLLYGVSFGPAVWLSARGYVNREIVEYAYRPLLWECNNGREPVATALHWWASFGIPSQKRMLE